MNKEDYEVVEFRGRRLLRVPELLQRDKNDRAIGGPACDMCVAKWHRSLCDALAHGTPYACRMESDPNSSPCVFIPESKFTEYVVEMVRRRVS